MSLGSPCSIALLLMLCPALVGCGEDKVTNPGDGWVPPTFQVRDWAYDMTPDGQKVIYRHIASQDYPGGVYVLSTSAGAAPEPAFADSEGFFVTDCRFSPDGLRVVYTRDFRSDIYVRDLATRTDTRVTFTDGNAIQPDWAPTGNAIVYARVFLDYGMPDSSAGIHVVDLGTLGDRSFTVGGAPQFGGNPRWSPNGEDIAFSLQTHVGARTPPHIYVARIDGTARADLTPGDLRNNDYPTWMNSGADVLFESYDPNSYRIHKTQLVERDGSGRRDNPVDVRPYITSSAVAPIAGTCIYTGADSANEWGILILRNLNDAAGTTCRQLTTFDPPNP